MFQFCSLQHTSFSRTVVATHRCLLRCKTVVPKVGVQEYSLWEDIINKSRRPLLDAGTAQCLVVATKKGFRASSTGEDGEGLRTCSTEVVPNEIVPMSFNLYYRGALSCGSGEKQSFSALGLAHLFNGSGARLRPSSFLRCDGE
eukprot:s448_g30.t1